MGFKRTRVSIVLRGAIPRIVTHVSNNNSMLNSRASGLALNTHPTPQSTYSVEIAVELEVAVDVDVGADEETGFMSTNRIVAHPSPPLMSSRDACGGASK